MYGCIGGRSLASYTTLNNLRAPRALLLMICIAVLAGCDLRSEVRSEVRNSIEIQEKTTQPPMAAMTAPGTNGFLSVPLIWTAPSSWKSLAPTGMRLATFHPNGDTTLDISLTALPQGAGGSRANIERWLGQAKIELGSDELEAFLKQAPEIPTAAGWKARIYDFSSLNQAQGAAQGLWGAVIPYGTSTLFVKLSSENMGQIPGLRSELESFVRSLQEAP
jgi:hypothetical protein